MTLILLYYYSSSQESRARDNIVLRLKEANQIKASDPVRAYLMYEASLKEGDNLAAGDKVALSTVLEKARAARDELRQSVEQVNRRREEAALHAKHERQRVEEERTQRISEITDRVRDGLMIVVTIAIGVFLYFSPVIVASSRGHHNSAAILVVNMFLGWTFLGWVIALAWALTKVEKR
jgi:hypothetical protein